MVDRLFDDVTSSQNLVEPEPLSLYRFIHNDPVLSQHLKREAVKLAQNDSQSDVQSVAQNVVVPIEITDVNASAELHIPIYESFMQLNNQNPNRMGDFTSVYADTKGMRRVFDGLFQRFDRGNKGYLDAGDLNEALMDPILSSADIWVLDFLRKNITRLQKMSNDEYFFDNDGVYRADVEAFVRMFDVSQQWWSEVKPFLDSHIRVLSADNYLELIGRSTVDGILQHDNIRGVKLTPEGRRSLEFLITYWDEIANTCQLETVPKNMTGNPISSFDIQTFKPGRAVDGSTWTDANYRGP